MQLAPVLESAIMHIGVLTHNYPRFPGDFSGTFIEALCHELAHQQQRVTIWAPYDPAYRRRTMDDGHRSIVHRPSSIVPQSPIDLRLYRYIWPDRLHQLGYMRSMQADLLTANSAELREAVIALGSPRTQRSTDSTEETLRRKFDLIIYGTDPDALKPDPTGVAQLRQQLQLPPSSTHDTPHDPDGSVIPTAPIILLCVGRMVPKKGFDVLIRALAEPALSKRQVVAVMVGEGDEKRAWQRLADNLGVSPHLRWVGNAPKSEIGVYYNLADLLINPSVSNPADGLNVCVLDAMSCAKPVIGSNVAGNPLAIVDGETGLITPEGDPAALAEAIARLADDPALRTRMGEAARRRIETELGWPHLARRYIGHFARLAHR